MIRIGFAVLMSFAGVAVAQPVSDWGDAGVWAIKVDAGNGNGCFMQRDFESGTVVRLGYVPDKKGAFLLAVNADWEQIEEGQEGSVIFDFGDSRFQGAAVGIVQDGLPGGYAFFNNPEFTSEFARRPNVKIIGGNGGEEQISLSGSSAALGQLDLCQAEQVTE
ncbi:hypothetical protein [Shimia abyssi]|uniref:Invasion protein IalB n=1 Tax=Shimia abyssi TaxID=1662395 RepID=A0A2P8F046_9RHOB|nr:hypothetical protein [Shimia abyssi]PSL15094.1 hypothetical protein CLV88_12613 [Shimia abyssi]